MKKYIALILCLLLTLTACGGETTPETTAVPETTAAPETTVPETTAAPETEAPTTEPQAAFDPHWAGEAYEMPIPQPPFTQFVVEDKGSMFTINSADPAELAEITEEVFNAYCDALVEASFVHVADQSTGEGYFGQPYYHFLANTEDNIGVELYFDTGSEENEREPSFLIVVVLG